jgi:hypothetical protein
MSGVGFLAACDDQALLGIDLWPRQRELAAAVEAGPRMHVWALGRRSGKTMLGALVALWDCLLRPELDGMVRPGERRYAVAVATNMRQARLFVDAARSIVERSPLLRDQLERTTEDELTFSNGTALAAFPCTSRGGRGWPISTLLMDEAAHFVSETEGFQEAARVFSSLAPSTVQFGDAGRIIVASTPYGTSGFFAGLYQQAATGELADGAAQHATTQEANPTVPADVLAREQARDPDGFRGEYLAEFTGSGDAYLDFDRFEIGARGELPPEAATSWVAGLDPAFASDPFGLALVGRDRTNKRRLLLGFACSYRPLRGPGSFDARLAEVIAVCKRYRARVVTDQFCAAPILDRVRSSGLQVRVHTMNATTKTAVFGELRARLYQGDWSCTSSRA